MFSDENNHESQGFADIKLVRKEMRTQGAG